MPERHSFDYAVVRVVPYVEREEFVNAGVVLICRALGVRRIEQNAANFDASVRIRNDRVIALPIESRREAEWQTLDDVPARVREEWLQFTIAAGALDGKNATAVGWGGRDDALSLITSAADAHRTT